MSCDVPPILTDLILSGPEVVAAERALAAILERYGISPDDLVVATDYEAFDHLPAIYARWEQQARRLDSCSLGLSIDGHGLLVMPARLLDVPVVVMALKGRLFDLSMQSLEGDDGLDEREVEVISTLIVRLEHLL